MVIWYTLLNQIKHKQKISKSSGSQICPVIQAKRSRQTEMRIHTLPRLWRNLNWRQHQMWWLLLLGKQRKLDPILTLRSEWKKLVVPNDRKPCKFKQDEAVTSPNHSRENRTSSIEINWKKSSDCASSSLCIASRWVWFHSAILSWKLFLITKRPCVNKQREWTSRHSDPIPTTTLVMVNHIQQNLRTYNCF
jgi:hypothetical protein